MKTRFAPIVVWLIFLVMLGLSFDYNFSFVAHCTPTNEQINADDANDRETSQYLASLWTRSISQLVITYIE